MQEVYWGAHLGHDGLSIGQREKLNRDAVAAEASAYPTGSSGAGMAFRVVLNPTHGLSLVPLHQLVIGCRLSSGRSVTLISAAPGSWGRFP